jgi:sugar phosphate permease
MVGLISVGGSGSVWAAAALLGLSGLAVYGINSLLLTSLPLSFSQRGHVGAVAGFLDFASYVGGGISALAVGLLLNRQSWNAVFLYWLVATLIALGGGVMLGRRTQ